jgi:hypothetical protein
MNVGSIAHERVVVNGKAFQDSSTSDLLSCDDFVCPLLSYMLRL